MVPESEVGNGSTSDVERKETEQKQEGYNVEKRYHKKEGKEIYAVNFTERMERDAFLAAKKKAKDGGGYYSSFGKGGFIFDTEEAANNFGRTIIKENAKEGNKLPSHITTEGYISEEWSKQNSFVSWNSR